MRHGYYTSSVRLAEWAKKYPTFAGCQYTTSRPEPCGSTKRFVGAHNSCTRSGIPGTSFGVSSGVAVGKGMAMGLESPPGVGTWTGTTVGADNGVDVSVSGNIGVRYYAWDGYQQHSRHSLRELCSSLTQGKKERLNYFVKTHRYISMSGPKHSYSRRFDSSSVTRCT